MAVNKQPFERMALELYTKHLNEVRTRYKKWIY